MMETVRSGTPLASILRWPRRLATAHALFCCCIFFVSGLFGCETEDADQDYAWRSFLVGSPEIPCIRDSDCPVGTCALDGCKSIANTPRYATRVTMLHSMERLVDRCGGPCQKDFDQELETLFAETSVSSPLVLIRLAEAMTLHSDGEKTKASLRAKLREVTELETSVSLQVVLARLGDGSARAELSKIFPTGDSIVDLLLLSAGVGRDVGPERLCEIQSDLSVPLVLRALVLDELCVLGEQCPDNGKGVSLRPPGHCRSRAGGGG